MELEPSCSCHLGYAEKALLGRGVSDEHAIATRTGLDCIPNLVFCVYGLISQV